MLEVVYKVPIVIDNGQEKSHKKLTFSINIATNQTYIAIIAGRDGILTVHFL